MRQNLRSQHVKDEDGTPTGGVTYGLGIEIHWQHGPLGRGTGREEPNGAFVEGVIEAALDRLEYYNSGKFRCLENELAITKLEDALHWLDARTAGREARDVEGTHEV